MAEKLREELINDIMSKNVSEGNEDDYNTFLETLSIEELQAHYKDILNNE